MSENIQFFTDLMNHFAKMMPAESWSKLGLEYCTDYRNWMVTGSERQRSAGDDGWFVTIRFTTEDGKCGAYMRTYEATVNEPSYKVFGGQFTSEGKGGNCSYTMTQLARVGKELAERLEREEREKNPTWGVW